MTVSRRQQVEPLDPLWYVAFPVYYTALALFGFVSAVLLLPTLVEASGSEYAHIWGLGVGASSVIAAVGGIGAAKDSFWLRWVEMVGVCLTIGFLLTYAWAIYASSSEGPASYGRVPGSIMPLCLAVFPSFRVLMAIRSGKLRHPRGA